MNRHAPFHYLRERILGARPARCVFDGWTVLWLLITAAEVFGCGWLTYLLLHPYGSFVP